MSDNFKKFIDTSGKSLDEIKKIAETMVRTAAKTVFDEAEKCVKSEIRKKIHDVISDAQITSDNAKTEKIPPKTSAKAPLPDKNSLIQADEIAYPHESLSDNLSARERVLVEKIAEMRKLRELSYNGYIVQRCAEVTFVLQGEFLADETDDFPRNAFCGMPTPMYAAMSVSQLRTYLTWRTDARRGIYRQTDKSYVLLYAYELLNKIGVLSSADAFGRLVDLWNGCEFAGYLNDLMPRWLKDFYAFNNISDVYPDINAYLKSAKETGEDIAAEDILGKNYRNKLDFLAENSAYDIKKSSFYNEDTAMLLNTACEKVLAALDKYFTEKDIDFGALLCGQLKKDFSWKPFDGALVNTDRMDGFHAVRISAAENYCIRRGEPVFEHFAFMPQKGVIGYILKSVEARLRADTGYKRKIVPSENMLINDLKNREKILVAVTDRQFNSVIANAVDDFCRENALFAQKKSPKISEDFVQYTKKDISIDLTKLEKIREQSEETAKKLIVEDAPDEDFIEMASAKIADEEFDEKISEYSALSEVTEVQNATDLPDDIPEEWRNFFSALTSDERSLLAEMSVGESAEAFCRAKGLLPETVFEGINSKAMEYVLDIVIDNGEIIPDYIDIIKKSAR